MKKNVFTKNMLKIITHENIKDITESINYELASAFNYVNTSQKYLVCYTKNDIFCYGQSEKLIEIMKNKNIDFTEFYSNNKKDIHCYPISWKGEKAKQFNKLLIDFINN